MGTPNHSIEDGDRDLPGVNCVIWTVAVEVVVVVVVAVTVDVAGVTVVSRKEEQSCLVCLVVKLDATTASWVKIYIATTEDGILTSLAVINLACRGCRDRKSSSGEEGHSKWFGLHLQR